ACVGNDACGNQTPAAKRPDCRGRSCCRHFDRACAQRSRHHPKNASRWNCREDEAMIVARELQGTEITVPGSIANLGPGLDTLAVAVQLYLRLLIKHISSSQRGALEFHFGPHSLTG